MKRKGENANPVSINYHGELELMIAICMDSTSAIHMETG